MLKSLCIAIFFILSLSVYADDSAREFAPEIFSEADLKGENPEFLEKYLIIASFKQHLQLPSGKLSRKKGRVLVIENGGIMYIAFYIKTDSGKFRKIGRTLAVKNADLPRQDIHPDYNIPCLILRLKDKDDSFRVYLYNGNTVIQKAENSN